MQGSSFLRPDPTASSPTRMRLAPLQHSPSANAARVHVPTQSEVNARLGGSFSVFNQYANKNISALSTDVLKVSLLTLGFTSHHCEFSPRCPVTRHNLHDSHHCSSSSSS